MNGWRYWLSFARRALWGRWDQRRGDQFTRAYGESLSHRLPLLYLVVVFDTLLLSGRFAGDAPLALVLIGPLLLGGFAASRAFYWLPANVTKRSIGRLRGDLQRMSWVGAVSALLFALWAVALYGYGDSAQRSLVHYLTAITLFSGVLGLGHSPLTALRMALAVTVPTTLCFLFSGHPNAVQVVQVQVVVTFLLLMITNGYHRDFVRLELSRQQLVRRERQAARLAQDNHRQASIDPLTGAMNRRAILARLDEALIAGESGPSDTAPWLALIDLDGFKHVNDTYGHAAGDAVLRAVAERICAHEVQAGFGRLGGDEFAMIVDGRLDGDDVRRLATDLSEALRAPIPHNGAVLRLSGSVGIHRVRGRSASECLERADAALYKAKRHGDGAVVVFGADDEIALLNRAAITRKFNDCALGERLRLLYQPMLDVETGATTGFEAFARWSPDGVRWLAPGEFMAMAEATGRTGELTRMVLARALEECPAWEFGRTLSINLSPRDVMRTGTVDALADLVRESGAPPQSILLEVTERALMSDARRAEEQLRAFRDRGFRIALDDFGAGWSSLSQVHRLPLDMIKIDQELARALASDPGARALVGTIVALSWQLGIDCTIEGVEDASQAETARALGIRLMQGYHFARPEPAGAAMRRLRQAA